MLIKLISSNLKSKKKKPSKNSVNSEKQPDHIFSTDIWKQENNVKIYVEIGKSKELITLKMVSVEEESTMLTIMNVLVTHGWKDIPETYVN